MTLNPDELRALCGRRDAGVVAAAAVVDPDAARLLAGTTERERQALIEDGATARQQLINENLGLVGFAVARHRPTSGLDREDLFQEGVIGLAAAVDRFDPAKSDRFASFALLYIRSAVSGLVSSRGGDLRAWQGRIVTLVEREIGRREALGMPTGTAAIADSLQLSQRSVLTSLSYRPPAVLTVANEPLDRPMTGTGDQRGRPDVTSLLSMLPPHERRVLEAVHGDTAEGRTMAQIAADLGLSRRTLRAVVDSGHRHLRSLLGKTDPESVDRSQGGHRPHDQPRARARGVGASGPGR